MFCEIRRSNPQKVNALGSLLPDFSRFYEQAFVNGSCSFVLKEGFVESCQDFPVFSQVRAPYRQDGAVTAMVFQFYQSRVFISRLPAACPGCLWADRNYLGFSRLS